MNHGRVPQTLATKGRFVHAGFGLRVHGGVGEEPEHCGRGRD